MKNMTVYFNPSEFLKDVTGSLYRDLPRVQQAQPGWAPSVRRARPAGPWSCAEREPRTCPAPALWLLMFQGRNTRQSHAAASSQPT